MEGPVKGWDSLSILSKLETQWRTQEVIDVEKMFFLLHPNKAHKAVKTIPILNKYK